MEHVVRIFAFNFGVPKAAKTRDLFRLAVHVQAPLAKQQAVGAADDRSDRLNRTCSMSGEMASARILSSRAVTAPRFGCVLV